MSLSGLFRSQLTSSFLFAALAAIGADAGAAEPPRLRLDEAIRRAMERNPNYETAREEVRRAEALVEEARAQSLPTLYGTGMVEHLAGGPLAGGSPYPLPVDILSANAALSVPIVATRSWALWSHASENVGVSRATSLDIRRQVALAAGHAYLAVVAEKRVLEANVRARDTARAHFDYAHSRLVGGIGNRIDEVRAGQELSADESRVQSSYASIAKAQEALSVLVGANGPVDSEDEPALAQPPPLPEALAEAERNRADVLAARVREDAAHHVRRDSWTDYSPYLTGVGQAFYQNPATIISPETGWQVSLILTVPFYDGGLRDGLRHERASLEREAQIALDATLRQAKSDVRAAFETLKRADNALAAARDAADLAHQALDLANLAYQAGATTNIEVIDAERQARDAETQAEVAADSARQARLDMLSAAGRFP